MNKIRKVLLSVIVLLLSSIFVINVDAAIKETTDDFDGNTYVIGSTKFDNETVVTAARAAQAGSDDAVIRYMKTNVFERIEVKMYFYNARIGIWYEIPKNEKAELIIIDEEEEIKEIEENLEIYFVNDEEKQIEFEYSGDVDPDSVDSMKSISGLNATYKEGKFYIPATTTDVWFETTDGESVDITITYDEETYEPGLGDFYIPFNVKVLDEFGEYLDTYLQTNPDGTLGYYEYILTMGYKEGYSLYYVDAKGQKVDFETFVATENTSIKQAWKPVGAIRTDMYNLDVNNVLTHLGMLQKTDDGYEISAYVVAPKDYDTKDTLINGEKVEFVNNEFNSEASIVIPINNISEEVDVVVNWEEGEEVTFKIRVDEHAQVVYKAAFCDPDGKVIKEVKGLFLNSMLDSYAAPTVEFTKENKVLDGWTLDPETNELYDFNQNYVTDNIKLYPRFVSLSEFIENAEGIATLPTDVNLTETALLDVDKSMHLDLGGHTITANGFHAIRLKGTDASLYIENGRFVTTGGGAAVAIGADKEDTSNVINRILNVAYNVTINSEYYGLVPFGKSQIDFAGTIVIEKDGYGISGNGNPNNEGTVINIQDGASITALNGAAIYQPQAGVTNIYNGTFKANTVVGIKAGNLYISGGKFISTGELQAPKPNGNGFDFTGDIILAEENASYADHINIDITGGEFDNSNGGAIVREFNPSIGTANERTVTVSGLYATRKTTDAENVFVYVDSNEATLEVKGVKYSTDDFEYALENSSSEYAVYLLNDITVTETALLDVDKDMVLDLRGYTITSEGPNVIRMKGNDASLSIQNGTFNVGGYGTAVAVGQSQDDTSNVIRRELTVANDVYINSQYYGITVFGKSTVDFSGHITLSNSGYGISGNGLAANAGTEINIYDGATITASTGAALYLPQTGVTNIYGGIFDAHTVVGIKAGNLNIINGTFRALATELNDPKANGNGFDLTGDIIIAEENAAYADHIVIDIQGGTFDNTNGGAIVREFNPSLKTDNPRTVTVNGLYATRKTTKMENVFEYVDSNLTEIQLNATGYTKGDLKYAIENSSETYPVTLLTDIVLDETVVLEADNEMHLDLDNHTITANGFHAIRLKGTDAKLSIDKGKFVTYGGGSAVAIGADKEDTTGVTRRELTINSNVEIESEYYGLVPFGKSQINFFGSITITGDGYGISGNGNKNNEGTLINVNPGSSITALNGAAIYQPQAGTTNITGGELTAHTVVGIKAGNLNITGGTFTSTGALADPAPNGNGFDLTGDIILAEENAAYADHIKIDITAGTFNNTNGGAIVREFNPSLGTENERTVTVTGSYATRTATELANVFVYTETV